MKESTKRTVGIISLIICVVCVILWILILLTGSAFNASGFRPITIIVFILVGISGSLAKVCLAGDVIRYTGKKFEEGKDLTKRNLRKSDVLKEKKKNFCPHCGQPVEDDHAFCSNCGNSLN